MLVSPQRAKRPWQGQQEAAATATTMAHAPGCCFCAGNARVTGERNPEYQGTFDFTNGFAALVGEVPDVAVEAVESGRFTMPSAGGTSRVVCFSPDHGKTCPSWD